MGVAGAVGLLKQRGGAWASTIELKDMYVVIDLTNALYWFVKQQLLDRDHMDHYGTSMVKLTAFVRRMFTSLIERNVTPIVVLDGGTKSGQRDDSLVSKRTHFRRSCAGALRNLNQCRAGRRAGFYTHLPELANNAIKEVLRELEVEHVVQAHYEVYPVLEHWAREKQCPVITNHSDFILRNVPKGFIWTQTLRLPFNSTSPFMCTLYSHDRMLQKFNMGPERSSALKALSVFLRDDFCDLYYPAVNHVLKLAQTSMALTARRNDRLKTQRLIHVLQNCHLNPFFADDYTVRSTLASVANLDRTGNMLLDYDQVYDTYTHYYSDFGDCEFAQWFSDRSRSPSAQSNPVTQQGLLNALTRGEATAEFVSTLGAIAFVRTGVEDTRLYRSTFSLHDNCRQYLLDHTLAAHISLMHIYDRCQEAMVDRHLSRDVLAARSSSPAGTESSDRFDRDTLFKLFHFNAQQIESLASRLTSYGINLDNSIQLALQLLLARCACNLMYRDYYGNEDDSAQTLANTPSNLLKSSNNESATPESKTLYERKKKFLTAVLNSCIYHALTSQSDQDVPANTRVARKKMDEIDGSPPNIQPGTSKQDEFYQIKHMIEALNSVMHGYKELNSLYNFPGPNFHVSKNYDGVLVYKIMSKWSGNLQELLLRISDDVLSDLLGAEVN